MADPWYHRQPTLLPGPRLSPATVYLARATWASAFSAMSVALYALYTVRDAQLTPFELVIVGAALEGAAFLCEVPTGVVADVLSRRLSILIGSVLFGLGPVVWGLFPSFGGIIAGQLVLGVGFTFISGAQEAWLADEVGEEEAARLYPRAAQYRQAAGILGTLLGAAMGLLDHRLPFLIGGAGYALFALPLAMTMPEAGFRPTPREDGVSVWSALAATARGGLGAAAGSRAVRVAFFVTFFAGASSEAFDRLWGYQLLTGIGIPDGMDEVMLFGGIAVLGQLGGVVIVRLGRAATQDVASVALSRLLVVLYLVIGVSVAAFALAQTFWLAVVLLLVVFWARTAETPFFTAWVNRGLDPATRATVLSSVSQGNALGQLGGGPAFAVVAGVGSATVALLLGALVMVPSAWLMRLAARADSRADARPEA